MIRRHSRTRLTDYRSALAARGEIEIGVIARRRRRRTLAIAVVGLLLIGVAAWLYSWLLPDDNALAGGVFRVKMQCINEDCGFTGVVQVKAGQKFPLICPKCSERSWRQMWRCKDPECGYEFLPPQVGVTVRCPRCGGVSVGTAVEDGP